MGKTIFTLFIILFLYTSVMAQNTDSLQKQTSIMQAACDNADSYINKADSLIQYNQPKTRMISISDAAKASRYVLNAIQISKTYNDTIAIRNDFDRLAETYVMQNRFAEAKWYFLQSNTISRRKHDVPRIIAGLIQLSNVKVIISDFALARKDLNEAITLAKATNNIPAIITAERKLAAIYDRTGKLKEAKNLVTSYSLLIDSLKKAHATQLLAMNRSAAKLKNHTLAAVAKHNPIIPTGLFDTRLNIENGVWVIKN